MNINVMRAMSAVLIAVSYFSAKAQIYDTNNVSVQTFAGYGVPGLVDGTGALTAFWRRKFFSVKSLGIKLRAGLGIPC